METGDQSNCNELGLVKQPPPIRASTCGVIQEATGTGGERENERAAAARPSAGTCLDNYCEQEGIVGGICERGK